MSWSSSRVVRVVGSDGSARDVLTPAHLPSQAAVEILDAQDSLGPQGLLPVPHTTEPGFNRDPMRAVIDTLRSEVDYFRALVESRAPVRTNDAELEIQQLRAALVNSRARV